MNKTVENILVGGAVLLTSPIWIPIGLVKGTKDFFIGSKKSKQGSNSIKNKKGDVNNGRE